MHIQSLRIPFLLFCFSAASVPAQLANPAGGTNAKSNLDCSDPTSLSPSCRPGTAIPLSTTPAATPAPTTTVPSVYVDTAGLHAQSAAPTEAPADVASQPLSDLQQEVLLLTGKSLALAGHDVFLGSPTTFAPSPDTPVDINYVLGTGDEVVLRIWGHDNFSGRLTVDRLGNIYIPQVGAIRVAGETFAEAQKQIDQELHRTYRNFEYTVNLGSLRSIQIFVLGQASHPGSYTVSGLSTVLNALLASGGPNTAGSVRNVEVRRAGRTIASLDLYDVLLRGNKTADIRLQAGDVLFIPYAGKQVAVVGAVRNEAIYELRQNETLNDLLRLAGGPSATSDTQRITISRLDGSTGTSTVNLSLDAQTLATPLHTFDVVQVGSMLAELRDTVTIRGNLAAPGRFRWYPGMKLSDILPEKQALLTQDYWHVRTLEGRPSPLFQPIVAAPGAPLPDPYVQLLNNASKTATLGGAPTAPSDKASATTIVEAQQAASDQVSAQSSHHVQISIPVSEIDWSYAVIERLDPETLRSRLIPFNLGKLVLDHDPAQDLALQKGDVVTILSQADIHVSTDEQTKYVRVEGEVGSAGVYSVGPNDTLADLIRKAGGLTPKAFLYGSTFTRESARVAQQQRLDEYISSLSLEFSRSAAQQAAFTSSAAASAGAATAANQVTLQHLQQLRATGRVVLQLRPDSAGDSSVPALPLENGDTFRIPSLPLTINVVGAVYGQNTFLFTPGKRVRDYLTLAGNYTHSADKRRAFLIRADGSVLSSQSVHSGFGENNFDAVHVLPGDTIVIPEKPAKGAGLANLLDWSQLVSQFALGAVAIKNL